MIRKLVLSLIAVALLLSSPAVLVAQDGPLLDAVELTATTGSDLTGTAEHRPDMDPNGLRAAGDGPGHAVALVQWLQNFFSNFMSL